MFSLVNVVEFKGCTRFAHAHVVCVDGGVFCLCVLAFPVFDENKAGCF